MKSDSYRIKFETPKYNWGNPKVERIDSFKNFFLDKGFEVVSDGSYCKYEFISMPPFRSFFKFFSTKRKIILDIRDGWSIAQKSGYGGTTRNNPLKSWITRKIERFLISRSYMTITCTPGLQYYLSELSNKHIFLIPNGVSEQRLALIDSLKKSPKKEKELSGYVFVCAGKFSEYGEDKAKKVLNLICQRYKEGNLLIKIVGCDRLKNYWAVDYFKRITSGRGELRLIERVSTEKLLKTLMNADYGISIIRDPDYDFGTKVYDYIACNLPIINYFSKENNFTRYFDSYLDVPFSVDVQKRVISRKKLIEKSIGSMEFC